MNNQDTKKELQSQLQENRAKKQRMEKRLMQLFRMQRNIHNKQSTKHTQEMLDKIEERLVSGLKAYHMLENAELHLIFNINK